MVTTQGPLRVAQRPLSSYCSIISSTANTYAILAMPVLPLRDRRKPICDPRRIDATRCDAIWGESRCRPRECCACQWLPLPGHRCVTADRRCVEMKGLFVVC